MRDILCADIGRVKSADRLKTNDEANIPSSSPEALCLCAN
jgi:hypothetical protein